MAALPPREKMAYEPKAADPLSQPGSSFFTLMMDNAPDLIWAKDMDDNYVFANKAICNTLLMCEDSSDAIGKGDIYFANQEKEQGHLHTFGEICVDSDKIVKETGKPGRFVEEGFVRGKYLVLDVHKAPFFNERGEMVGTVGSARDITEQQAVEKQLKESEERFRQMADFLPLPIVETDLEFNLYYANRTAIELSGYTRKDYEKHPSLSQLIPKSQINSLRIWIEEVKQGKGSKPYETELVRKNGDRVFGMVTAAPIIREGEVTAIRACFTDLSFRRNAEIALRENENRFRTLFNGLNDAVFVHPFAEQGFHKFVEVNEVACEWYGYSREELLEMSPQDLILDPPEKGMGSRESRMNLIDVGKRTIEALNKKKNGDIFPVEISSSVFDFHDEKMILSTVRDITDRRQTEKEREDAVRFAADQEKYALVGQVAGKMAHDFNNILGGIMGNAELSLIDCKEHETRQTLEIILDQTLKGKNLTKNLVAFAKDQEPKEEFFNINEKLDLVLSLMKKDLEGVLVIRQFKENLPELLADPGMIEHALVNLVQNAVHAMSKQQSPELRISTIHSMNCLVIEIEDNGCGIPRQYHEKIYTPSFTLKGKKDILGTYDRGIRGTGYGMCNVKKYIQKHKGGLAFNSKEGQGTCFVISIPLVNKELIRKEKNRMQRKHVVSNKRILLVEDETAISGVQEKILSHTPFNHQVVLAATGQEAITLFDNAEFDLVSLDYLLPGRLNGMDVYSHIRRKNPDIPVIFLSGNIEFIESMKELAAHDPRVDHLSKPCENIVYADTVNDWLARFG